MDIQVSPNFKLSELVDKNIFEKHGAEALRFLRPELIRLIQKIRWYFNKPMKINDWKTGGGYNWSGLRTPEYKGYDITSIHSWGGADDIKIKGLHPEEIRQELFRKRDTLFLELTGLELKTTEHVHIDTRVTLDGKLFSFCPPV